MLVFVTGILTVMDYLSMRKRQPLNIHKWLTACALNNRVTHTNRFQEVQVGQEVALGFIQPVTGGPADNFLSHTGHIMVCNVHKLLQWRGVTEVSEMETKTFGQHLDKRQNSVRNKDKDRVLKNIQRCKERSQHDPVSNIYCRLIQLRVKVWYCAPK